MVMDIYVYNIIMINGFEFDGELFFYFGSIGCNFLFIFFLVDVCIDLEGNFFVIDFYDDMVYFLDLKGKFLWIIMFVEDGLSGIECIVMDSLGWFWIGCDDGMMYFVNYDYFKNIMR